MAVDVRVEEYTVGMVQTNCYFIVNQKTNEGLIVDPGAQPKRLAELAREHGVKPVAILLTHCHCDHADGVEYMAKEFGIPVYVHEQEKEGMENPSINLSAGITGMRKKYHADIFVKDEEELELAGLRIKVLLTPGHTPGGCCYYFEDAGILASGDTLFRGSIGRTDFPGGDYKQLINAIRTKLLVLPRDTEVLPGHEARTKIAYEADYNPFLN